MKTCNLGDSGYLLVRPQDNGIKKLFRSASQQSRFNAPYQTGTEKTWPTKAFSTEHYVENNDIVVMGSDGIFDNLFDDDIISCLETQIKNRKIENLQNASNCLSMSAEIKGYDPTYNSPFAIEAKAAGKKFKGGKADDITVIVAQI